MATETQGTPVVLQVEPGGRVALTETLLSSAEFILGFLDFDSPEGRVLRTLDHPDVTLMLSSELVAQIRRVARRTGGKDRLSAQSDMAGLPRRICHCLGRRDARIGGPVRYPS